MIDIDDLIETCKRCKRESENLDRLIADGRYPHLIEMQWDDVMVIQGRLHYLMESFLN